ncbi:hypothetical protein [Desulfovibrio litoralis]|uniref:Uncharacterized protein n=1 Tax=Desulfovibrio litoralis DSM 11393 TaxID=1121455 RepID=A0A1M7S8S3_9BACT|nr:hypothetical protein [Desulfovibrio litoralis]SHN54774.1 hypothetical protein SAMN02745728_00584 [Desulfovibrio litoralis DSM 11393]
MIKNIKKLIIILLSLNLFFSFSYPNESLAQQNTKKTTQKQKTNKKAGSKKQTSSKKKTNSKKKKSSKKKKTSKKSKNSRAKSSKKTQVAQENITTTTLKDIPLEQAYRKNSQTPLNQVFSTPIQARVYQVNQNGSQWLLEHKNYDMAAKAIASLKPSLVSNFVFFEKNALPDPETQETLQEIRGKIRQNNPKTYFEVVLDINNYKSPEELVAHMRNLTQKLDFESFFIQGLAGKLEQNPELVFTAISEAKAQNRLIATNTTNNLPIGLTGIDYIYTPVKDAELLTTNITNLKTELNNKKTLPIPILATTQNSFGSNGFVKSDHNFVTAQTPSERRKLLLAVSKKQEELGINLAYPLFFPLYKSDITYDALRDEFMYDTLKRIIKTADEHKSVFTKVVLD